MSRVRVLNISKTAKEADLITLFTTPLAQKSSSNNNTGNSSTNNKTRSENNKKPGGGGAAQKCRFESVVDKADVTECSFVRNKEGRVRMGFVGFRKAATAANIVKAFNGAFLGNTKITVDLAMDLQQSLPSSKQGAKQQQQQHQQQQQEHEDEKENTRADKRAEKRGRGNASSGKEGGEENIEEKREVLNTTTDDDFLSALTKDAPPMGKEEGQDDDGASKKRKTESKAENVFEEIVSRTRRILVTNIPYCATEDEIKNYFSTKVGPVQEVHVPVTRDTKQSKGKCFVKFATVNDAVEALALKGHIFMGRLINVAAAEDNPYQNGVAAAAENTGEGTDKEGAPVTEKAAAATTAQQEQTNSTNNDGTAAANKEPTFKQKRGKERKEQDTAVNWNTLYMSSDNAITKLAEKLDVQKRDIIGVHSPGGAVKSAVAEALLTTEAKNFLGEEGIDLDLLKSASEQSLHRGRSNTTILVKDIGGGTAAVQKLTSLFAKSGQIETIAATSDGSFVVVAFLNAKDARTAFQRLAYKRFENKPLLLEWAPMGALKDDFYTDGAATATSGGSGGGGNNANQSDTVYITNLPFNISEEDFAAFLQDCAPRLVRESEKIIRNINLLSHNGRAFVQTCDGDGIRYLLSRLQGRSIGDRAISAVISKDSKTVSGGDGTSQQQQGRQPASAGAGIVVPPDADPLKLIVKNLPFEATEKDLKELFAAFVEVKSVRIPKKSAGMGARHLENNHRGFGFVEFLTEKEAKNALATLSSTHLYGRHLVLQFAKKGNSVV